MTESQPAKKHHIKRYGVLRFVCIACRFEVNPSRGVTYQGANKALGAAGWRIERRGYLWGPVCNLCATPDAPQEIAA